MKSLEITDKTLLKILDAYASPNEFLNEAINLFDKLLTYHAEIMGFYSLDEIKKNWVTLISSCRKSIDFIIQSSIESGYCKFE